MIYSAGIEALSKAWFASTHSRTHGTYISKERFNELLDTLLREAQTRLHSEPYGERIFRRMSNAYNMGSHERAENLFSEIGIRLGDTEEAARRARNLPAHGKRLKRDEELLEFTIHRFAYKVLFERGFLRLLGYSGQYRDRTSLGHPLRDLAEPASGQQQL